MNIEIPRVSFVTVFLRTPVSSFFFIDTWRSYFSVDWIHKGHHRLRLIQNNQKELKFFVCIQMSR